jgi:SAM-dependent methyltransferase
MRVVDLDRDMRDVIPTGATLDSQFLFERMTEVTLSLAAPGPARTILDVASGFGQDAIAMGSSGARVVGVDPSVRMTGWARLQSAGDHDPLPAWVRAWSDALPFASGSFDAVICKGALDHFDRPCEAIAEMARVTRPEGLVVLAIANFESLACRAARLFDAVREVWLGAPTRRGRRHYDVPADHFTRYELDLMREHASKALHLEVVRGVSLAWGLPLWGRGLECFPSRVAHTTLQALDGLAGWLPSWADVVVLAGRPRCRSLSFSTSR